MCTSPKSLLVFFILLLALAKSVRCQVLESPSLNTIRVESAKDLHRFFRYTGSDVPLISGHRGGMEPGFPENSIEALEHVLEVTTAFFEIDPRLTKDGVIVLMHDAMLERTTNGVGKLIDLTWEEAQQLYLKDVNGKVTPFRIPRLEDVIRWSRGKTIVNLDHKDVPLAMTAALVKKLDAFDHVMITVHKPEEARYYLDQSSDFMFSAFVRSMEEFDSYEKAGIPWGQIMAYVGSLNKPENRELYAKLHDKGVMVMVSAAPSYDKLDDPGEQNQAYQKVFLDGADVLESDYPIRVAKAIKNLLPTASEKNRFFDLK